MCRRCHITNREAAVLGRLDVCEAVPEAQGHVTYEAVEAAAKRAYEAKHKGLSNCWKWDDAELDRERPDAREHYLTVARATIAPLLSDIARLTAERDEVRRERDEELGDEGHDYLAERDEARRSLADVAKALHASLSREKLLREALERIQDLEPEPYVMPADWGAQIEACSECQRYKNHPIQQGICDTHRRPLWDRQVHDSDETKRLGYRAKSLARAALNEGGKP